MTSKGKNVLLSVLAEEKEKKLADLEREEIKDNKGK